MEIERQEYPSEFDKRGTTVTLSERQNEAGGNYVRKPWRKTGMT